MKRGGQEIYVGPLGRHSSELIKYFEVRFKNQFFSLQIWNIDLQIEYLIVLVIYPQQVVEGVSKIKGGYNPATWMLEVTASSQELVLGADFTDIYKKSDLYR